MRAFPALPLLLLLLAGCGAADDPTASAVLESWSLEEEMRIGSLDDPELSLTTIGSVTVGPDGRIYVAQPMDQQVRIFGPDGRPLGAFGRKGAGPGEFESVGGLVWRGDTLWVSDWRHRRFSLFTPDGELIETVTPSPPTASEASPYPAYPTSVLPDGTLMGSAGLPSHLIASGEITTRSWLRFDHAGSVIDTIATLPIGNAQLTLTYENGMMFTGQPFGDAHLTGVHPDTAFLIVDRSVRVGPPPTFTLTKLRLGGDTLFQRSYPYRPIPVTGAEADSLAEAWVERMSRGSTIERMGGALRARGLYRDALYVPPHRPPVRGMSVGRDGTIWLRMTDEDPESTRYIVLDRHGDPQAEVHLPLGANIRSIDRDVLWASETDELDVPYLVRYRIQPLAGDMAAGR